jgi:hypothetical protein
MQKKLVFVRKLPDGHGEVQLSAAVIPALGRTRQEGHEFEASLGYIARHTHSPRKKKEKKSTNRLTET